MRRSVSLFLVFSVLLSSSGLALSKHFCGGELAHISLGDEQKTCCEGEADMPSDCCHDQLDQLLLDDSQLDHQTLKLSPLTFITVSVLVNYLTLYHQEAINTQRWTVYHSPPLPSTPVYLRVQSFLI